MSELAKLNLRLPQDLRDAIAALADAEGLSMNSVCIQGLRNWVGYRVKYVQSMAALPALPSREKVAAGTAAEEASKFALIEQARKPIGRNQPCWCGSKRKFKHCHGVGR